MTCDKCGGLIVADGEDTRCVNCGRRPGEARRHTATAKRTSEDLVALVMREARKKPAEEERTKLMATCTKGSCPDEAADDSVRCPKHRDMQRAMNRRYTGRDGLVKRKPGRPPKSQSETLSSVSTLPAKRPQAPITLAEPTLVTAKPVRRLDLHGNVLTVLDAVIGTYAAELATLQGAREILERQ